MTEVEEEVRRHLHASLDAVTAEPQLAHAARRAARGVRRRRLATAGGTAAVVVVVALMAYAVPARDAADVLGTPPSSSPSASVTRGAASPLRALDDVKALGRADFASLRDHMTPTARLLLTESELRALWSDVTSSRGSFRAIVSFAPAPLGDGLRSMSELLMSRGRAYLRIDYAADGNIQAIVLTTEPQSADDDDPARTVLGRHARELVRYLAAGDYAAVRRDFDRTMSSELSVARLRAGWDDVVSLRGKFLQLDGQIERDLGNAHVVRILCVFERGLVEARVSYDGNAQVAGLYLLPVG